MNSKIAKKIEKIEQLRAQISSLPPLTKDVEKKLWDKFRLEWNYNSNHIEGNTISYIEAKQFLFKNITDNLHTMREWEELSGHNLAVETIKEWATNTEQPLNESDIRSLHTMILVKPYWSDAITANGTPTRREIIVGEYKTQPNHVKLDNGETFYYTLPMNVAAEMKALIEWYRTSTNVHPLIKATDFHYKFIRIHPFDDGNGRLARLLLNYELLASGYPPVIIKSVDKKKYLNCLQAADEGNFEPFYEFVADCLIWSLELVLKAHNNESLEEPDDLEKEIAVFKKKIKAQNKLVPKLSQNETKSLVLKQIKEFYIPYVQSLDMKIQNSFEGFFVGQSNSLKLKVNNISQYARDYEFNNEFNFQDFLDFLESKLEVSRENSVNLIIYYKLILESPKTKSLKDIKSLSVKHTLRIKNFAIELNITAKPESFKKEWTLDYFITDEEREELVKVVIKSIFDQIKNSVD